MQIAVDGPAGAGKSTIAKIIAQKLDIIYLDTGAMYRTITYGVLSHGIELSEKEKIVQFCDQVKIRFEREKVFLDDEDVTFQIRTPEVSKNVSQVSAIAGVRKILAAQQRKIASDYSVIMDGRDIGSVVLPNAEYKFYLDAGVDERARRRMIDLDKKGTPQDFETVKQEIIRRDDYDMHREIDPLVCANDAIVIDTTGLNIDQVCDVIMRHISEEK